MNSEKAESSLQVKWRTAAFALLLATVALAFYIAAGSDGLHLFNDADGNRQVVISTAVESGFWPALLVSAVIIGVLWLMSSFISSKLNGQPFARNARLDGITYLPLAVLLVTALRYVPGLAGFSSALFLFSATFGTILLFLCIVLVFALKIILLRPETGWRMERLSTLNSNLTDRAVGWIIFAVAMTAFAIAIPLFSAGWPFGGDEPHYLIVTHSIIEDGDIYIEDDHDAGVYRNFSQWQEIPPQYSRLTVDGRIIPFHRIGMPVLAIIPYLIAGKLGAVLMIGFFAALAMANLFWLVMKIVPVRWAALASTLWVFCSVPLLPLSFLFSTELPLVIFTLMALNLIIRRGGEPPRLPWLIPLLIWSLPWIHARGFFTAVVLTGLLLYRLRDRLTLAAGTGALCIALAITTPLFNLHFYGEFNLVAELGTGQTSDLGIANVLRNFSGLLFDQEFGLLLLNITAAFALFGLIALWRRHRPAFTWILLIVAFTVGPGLTYHMWWGGDSVAARYAAPVLPLAALPLAALLSSDRRKRRRSIIWIAIACSIAIGMTLVVHPEIMADTRDQVSKKLSAISAGPHDAVEWWPSWFAPQDEFWMRVGLLVIGVLFAVMLVRMIVKGILKLGGEKPLANAVAFPAGLIVLMLFLIPYDWAAGSITGGEPNGMRPRSRELDLLFLQRYRHGSHRFVDQEGNLAADSLPGRGFSARRLFSVWALAEDGVAGGGRSWLIRPGDRAIELTPSTPLWAGQYRLRVSLRSESGAGRARLSVINLSELGLSDIRESAAIEAVLSSEFMDFTLPLKLASNSIGIRLAIESDKPVRFQHAYLGALSLDRIEAWSLPEELFDKASLEFNEYTLYFEPRAIHTPDGKWFWTRGDSETAFTIVAGNKFTGLKLQLVGHPNVSATLDSGGASESVGFNEAGEMRSTELKLKPESFGDHWIAPLVIKTAGTYVPAEVIPGSEDDRRLGVHVRIVLKR